MFSIIYLYVLYCIFSYCCGKMHTCICTLWNDKPSCVIIYHRGVLGGGLDPLPLFAISLWDPIAGPNSILTPTFMQFTFWCSCSYKYCIYDLSSSYICLPLWRALRSKLASTPHEHLTPVAHYDTPSITGRSHLEYCYIALVRLMLKIT